MFYTALFFASIGVIALTIIRFYSAWEGRKLPPGPRGVPILGNLLQVPFLRPYPQFREWAKQYGSVFSLKFGPRNVIVLNILVAQASNELLHERSKIYSSRPSSHVAHDIMSAGQRIVFLPYDTEWKMARKTFFSAIGPQASKALHTVQEVESRVVLWDLMTHGDKSCAPEFSDPVMVASNVPDTHWFALIRRCVSYVLSEMSTTTNSMTLDDERSHDCHIWNLCHPCNE